MYELICPHCDATVPASPAKAGGEVVCPACTKNVAVPKLGELKKLPRVDQDASSDSDDNAAHGLSGGRSMLFAMLGAVSLLCFLGAAFCGVNWASIESPGTTESHIEGLKENYEQISASRLIREYEDITEYGVDIPQPYPYRAIELRKQAWASKAIAFGAAGLLAAVIAVVVGRRKKA
ncbi:hypothetical protein [Neorhodopirellula lusitana]|uniref:hypothetical protein n=1 Tax=Neorhodopirellula lusitana TaxID=445327 RepID=UPI00384CA1D9